MNRTFIAFKRFFFFYSVMDTDHFVHVSEYVLQFDDGLLGYDYGYEEFMNRDMFHFNGRFVYEKLVRLLLMLLEDIMAVVQNEGINEIWLRTAEKRLESCRRATELFSEHGNFTQWRKVTYYEHRILKDMVILLETRPELCNRKSIRESYRAWTQWRESHTDSDYGSQ